MIREQRKLLSRIVELLEQLLAAQQQQTFEAALQRPYPLMGDPQDVAAVNRFNEFPGSYSQIIPPAEEFARQYHARHICSEYCSLEPGPNNPRLEFKSAIPKEEEP